MSVILKNKLFTAEKIPIFRRGPTISITYCLRNYLTLRYGLNLNLKYSDTVEVDSNSIVLSDIWINLENDIEQIYKNTFYIFSHPCFMCLFTRIQVNQMLCSSIYLLTPVNIDATELGDFIRDMGFNEKFVSSLDFKYVFGHRKPPKSFSEILAFHDDVEIGDFYCNLYKSDSLPELFTPFIDDVSRLQEYGDKAILGSIWTYLLDRKYHIIVYDEDGNITKEYGRKKHIKIELLWKENNYYLIERIN